MLDEMDPFEKPHLPNCTQEKYKLNRTKSIKEMACFGATLGDTQGLLLAVLKRPYEMPEMKLESASCKA